MTPVVMITSVLTWTTSKVVAKKIEMWINYIKGAFLVKESDPRKYYLGSDYTYQEKSHLWTFGGVTYTKEAITRVERIFGYLPKQWQSRASTRRW